MQVKSQDSTAIVSDSIPINTINFNSSKLANTFILSSNANLDFGLFGGKLSIFHNFNGYTLNTFKIEKDTVYDAIQKKDTVIYITMPYLISTDVELLKMNYSLPIFDNISLVVENNLNYGSLNKLGRINLASGFKYNESSQSFFELKAGIEQNNQLGFNVSGPIFKFDGNLGDISVEDYKIQSSLTSEYVGMSNNKRNADLGFKTSLYRNFSDYDKIQIDIDYGFLLRDYISLFSIKSDNTIPIETWFDNKFNSDIKFDFSLTDFLVGKFEFNMLKNWINKYYKGYVSNNDITGINRNSDLFNINFISEMKYVSEKFIQGMGISFFSGYFKNLVTKSYNISDAGFLEWQESEKLKDFYNNSTNLYFNTEWNPTKKDRFLLKYSVSLFQFDSPSDKENSDGDKFTSLISGEYFHKFDNSFYFSIEADYYLYHMVYIKAKRSANNNWNKFIRINPKFSWKTSLFSMYPELDLSANYTLYDFEDSTYSIGSNINRQVSYRDSITVFLTKLLSLQSYINLKVLEYGILFRKNFSELPTNINFEKFVKIMLTSKITDYYYAGFGCRYYSYAQYSIAPEVDIKMYLLGNSFISLQGWYEFQFIGKTIIRKFPNFFLNTKIAL
ncbi:MAG: hypothetical protein EPN82_04770 [Bacteroidetes bacterium]|nr:MAG: hypothetical protein EPN82_04770 [Bacteroidota bacterium]